MNALKRAALSRLGERVGDMRHVGPWSDAELDDATRVGPEATKSDREHIRASIRFLRQLADSMERTLRAREERDR